MAETLLYESPTTTLYRLDTSEWNQPVVRKVLNDPFPTQAAIARFYNEYTILQGTTLLGSRRVLQRTKSDNRHAMLLEWVNGQTLTEVYKTPPKHLPDFLRVAIALAAVLAELHQHNIIHRNVNPANILVNPATHTVRLIDFGLATHIDLLPLQQSQSTQVEGDLAYISPEQTGRMNRTIDYRTDLYSLGVTLYECLAGQLPFTTQDALELVHAHIAQIPPTLHQLNLTIPEPLSAIVAKLLAKNAEDRYQSATGLKIDLEHCLNALEKTGILESFTLAAQDFSGKFSIPQTLYGREEALATLLTAFDECGRGNLVTALVHGPSGGGKSALVQEIHGAVIARRGHFIEGKFDQFQRSVPYYALIEAFKALVNNLLTTNEATLQPLQQQILVALGNEGSVLTAVIPNLEYIIGAQPAVTELTGVEAQNRFTYLFRRFIQVVATPAQPIVLFVDDLQWADSASLHLLDGLLTTSELGYLLVVGAYRTADLGDGHPLLNTLTKVRQSGGKLHFIEIGNLSRTDVHALVEASLNKPTKPVAKLADLVYAKTNGNAFFINQFLKSLHEQGLIWFDLDRHSWAWRLAQIKATNSTDNVVDLMADKIRRLPTSTQYLLRLASATGDTFTLATLVRIAKQSEEHVYTDLLAGIKEGIVMPARVGYRFAHDRIRQSAYGLIPTAEKATVHYTIGQELDRHTPASQADTLLFDKVYQYNQAIACLTDTDKDHVARLNLAAGRKAMQAVAFRPALDYFTTGISLLPPNPWAIQYSLSLDLYTEAAEAAYLNADIDRMDQYVNDVLQSATSSTDTLKAHETRVLSYLSQNRLKEALDTGLLILPKLGVHFPDQPNKAHVLMALLQTKWVLRQKTIAQLGDGPMPDEPATLGILRILSKVSSIAYSRNPNLMILMVLKGVRLSVQMPNPLQTGFYTAYGMILCELGDIIGGYQFGNMSLNRLTRPEAKSISCRTMFTFHTFIHHWQRPLSQTIDPLLRAYQTGLEVGDIESACRAYGFYGQHVYHSGQNLAVCCRELEQVGKGIAQWNQQTDLNMLNMHYQVALNLFGNTPTPWLLAGPVYNEDEMVPKHQAVNGRTALFYYYLHKMVLSYLFGRYDDALLFNQQLDARAVTGMYCRGLLPFYQSLVYLAVYEQAPASTRRIYDQDIQRNLTKINRWATHCPENQQHRAQLIQAEWGRVRGKRAGLLDLYEQAIQGARQGGFMHEEAIAQERAGMYFQSVGQRNLAEMYLKQAYQTYREREANAKLRHLEQHYPDYVASLRRSDDAAGQTGTAIRSEQLDIATVLKAATTISGEVVLDRLLTVLMEVVLENAGAQRGLLVLAQDDDLFLRARRDMGNHEAVVLTQIPLAGCGLLAESIVTFVNRTQQPVVIQDAATDSRFQADLYIISQEPKSILCLPILNQGKPIGVLYLENNLTTGAFTEERIQVLSLLSGQIATSIDNALLYDSLEQKVAERTAEVVAQKEEIQHQRDDLKTALQELRNTQNQLIQREKMASLGELMSGIAHEIQNPLNFVNNFADLSVNMLAELDEERQKGLDSDSVLETELFSDITQNLQKIGHHGRRASSIIRGMLEHVRVGSGDKRPTDLNALCDEYLRLIYQDLHLKDVTFTCRLVTDFSPQLPHITLVPQDISRVLINLFSNAFYAVREKQKMGIANYQPAITVSTRHTDTAIDIYVSDNGTGIPDAVKAKVFQPFFTTKPSGQGTGLGLSLSYDIITKGYGGEIRLETEPGQFTNLTVRLPIGQYY